MRARRSNTTAAPAGGTEHKTCARAAAHTSIAADGVPRNAHQRSRARITPMPLATLLCQFHTSFFLINYPPPFHDHLLAYSFLNHLSLASTALSNLKGYFHQHEENKGKWNFNTAKGSSCYSIALRFTLCIAKFLMEFPLNNLPFSSTFTHLSKRYKHRGQENVVGNYDCPIRAPLRTKQ